MITLPIELYTDGAAKSNGNGPAGLGYIIKYWNLEEGSEIPLSKEIEYSEGYRLSTNNRMEILAGIKGLQNIIQLIKDGILVGAKQVTIFSDSEYFCNSVNHKWLDKWMQNNWMTSGFNGKQSTPVKNKDLWELVIEVRSELQSLGINLTMTHVKGHSDNEMNNRCDVLASTAANNTNRSIDQVYENSLNNKRNY